MCYLFKFIDSFVCIGFSDQIFRNISLSINEKYFDLLVDFYFFFSGGGGETMCSSSQAARAWHAFKHAHFNYN